MRQRGKVILMKPKIEENLAVGNKERLEDEVLKYHQDLLKIADFTEKALLIKKGCRLLLFCGDVSLQRCHFTFRRAESFPGITGVGKLKLQEFGAVFLILLSEYAKVKFAGTIYGISA